jgi:putative DNA primase/helicase
LAEGNIRVKAGQGVRILDIAIAGSYGLVNELHGSSSALEFIEAYEQATFTHYGHAGPLFVRKLITLNREELRRRYRETAEKFKVNLHPDQLNGKELQEFAGLDDQLDAQEGRAAKILAIAAFAGELAIEWEILPWQKETAIEACQRLFARWRLGRLSNEVKGEDQEILTAVRAFVEKHGESRFAALDTDNSVSEPIIRDRAGYWTGGGPTANEPRLYLFTTGGLREATIGFDFPRVLKALDDVFAFAKKGPKQKSFPTRTPTSHVTRLYWINPEKLL